MAAKHIDVALLVMIDAEKLVGTVFSGLSALVIEDVTDSGGDIVVRARARGGPATCLGYGGETSRVHCYHGRTAADVPVDGRRVVVKVRARRMRCPVPGCAVQTFREQVPSGFVPSAAVPRPVLSRQRIHHLAGPFSCG
jgi:hypothetical protein